MEDERRGDTGKSEEHLLGKHHSAAEQDSAREKTQLWPFALACIDEKSEGAEDEERSRDIRPNLERLAEEHQIVAQEHDG